MEAPQRLSLFNLYLFTHQSPGPRAGRITSLVGKPDRVLAQRVEDALERGLPLDALSANKHVLPPHMR